MINCTLENGNKDSFRHVTVKSIVVNKKGEILLVKRAPHLLRGGKYDLPGGFMDRDEDTRTAALRELREEAGIDGIVRFLFRINDSPKRPQEDRQNVDFIYVVEAVSDKIVIDHESSEAGWFRFENLPSNDDFAFDHRESILKYFDYLKNPYTLPIVG